MSQSIPGTDRDIRVWLEPLDGPDAGLVPRLEGLHTSAYALDTLDRPDTGPVPRRNATVSRPTAEMRLVHPKREP